MATVKCSDFVKRQTKDSGYSHFNGSWAELEEMATRYLNGYAGLFIRPGYRDGVVLIDLPGEMFMSAIVKIDDRTKLNVAYAPRRDGEHSFIRVSAKAKKQKAEHASIVLYRADVLAEGNEGSTDADWEIVAIKARTSIAEEPMDPYTMARNFLQLPGGTKGDFTAEQFAQSIWYWNNHCMTTSRAKWWNPFTWFK